MESSDNGSDTDLLLLLKERIIKTDVLLDKYASLNRKCLDLEKSHNQAVENEKKAKRDAVKFLEKYCKLVKKSNCLMKKIKELEDIISSKSNELKESKDENAKLESVVQVYKTERKGHQCLKKDKDFLLTTLWKILKSLDGKSKTNKSKKIIETVLKKFERELSDLKLEDFKSNKEKNVNVLTLREKEVTEFLLSTGSQVLGSTVSDFIDADKSPESVKSKFEEFDENCVLEDTKYTNSNHRPLGAEHKSVGRTSEVSILENQDFSLDELFLGARENIEKRVDSVPQGENVLKDCLEIHPAENNDFNLCQNREEEGSTSVTLVNFSTEEGIIFDSEIRSNIQDQSECRQNYPNLKDKLFPPESEDKRGKKRSRKISEKFRKTYSGRKFQASGHSHKIMKKKMSDNRRVANTSCSANGAGGISDLIGISRSDNIDTFNVSRETISLDTDVNTEGIGNIPYHIEYCDNNYDFLRSSNRIAYKNGGNLHEEDSNLLVSKKDEVNKLRKVNSDTGNTIIPKSHKFVSVFDVGDNESSGRGHDNEFEDICVEFGSNNGNMTDLTEVANGVQQGLEKYDFVEHDKISRKTENENQVNEESQKIYNSSLKKIYTNCNSAGSLHGTIKNNISNLEFTRQEKDTSGKNVSRILKKYKRVHLILPIKEEVPKKRRKLSHQHRQKHDECNVPQNIKFMNSSKNMGSFEEVLHDNLNGEELVFNRNSEKEGKMADKLIQTDDKVVDKHEMEQQSNRVRKAVNFPETTMRKLSKIVWKKTLKKFKNLQKCGKVCNAHLSCLDCMKKLLEIINHSGMYVGMRARTLSLINRRMSQRSLQSCKRKVSSWLVEDVEETNTMSTSESLLGFPEAEQCNLITQVPVDYLPKDRSNESTAKSEQIRSQKNVSCNLAVSNLQVESGPPTGRTLEFYGNTCAYNVDREREFGSNIALRRGHPNVTVNNFEKENDSTEAHDITKNVENLPEIDEISSNVLEKKTDNLEKCAGIKQAKFQYKEVLSKTEKSVLVSRRGSQILSQNNLVMEQNNRTNGHSLTHKESHNLMEVDISKGSLRSANGTSVKRNERYPNKSINDSVPIKEVPEKRVSSTLKERFKEYFGDSESQSECSSESDKGQTSIKVQKEVSGNLQTNTNSDISDIAATRKKRRVVSGKSKGDNTSNKKMKWELLSVCSENSEESLPKSDVPLSHTFSSQNTGTSDSSNILDSIMTAMTKQSAFFKCKTQRKETEVSGAKPRNICGPAQPSQPKSCPPSSSVPRKISNEYRAKGDDSALLNLPYYWKVDNQSGKQAVREKEGSSTYNVNRKEEAKLKSALQREIRDFLSSDINSVEEGEELIKPCIDLMRKANESVIANTIVNEIMANVDEDLTEFDRPAPPLTPTQHRIMIILAVFCVSDEQFHRISNQILKIIRSKIFPENFFWPDDSLEMASRFYAAICKRLNDFKGIWKFCFQVLTSMRQRWCIPILVVLQVWPDIIHNAHYVQNNLLVNTFVSIILHAPKSICMRRKRQEQKLLAVKHLLINFYNFDVNSTIEVFTQKLWESLVSNAPGSIDALVLLCKCRAWSWTRKNVIPKVVETLESWIQGAISDTVVSDILDVLHQIATVFPDASSTEASSAKGVISVLSQVLATEKLNPASKEKLIKVLCDFCNYSDVRDVLLRCLEKLSTSEPLYGVIQKALSSNKRKYKGSCKKAKTKIIWAARKKMSPIKNKTNSSR